MKNILIISDKYEKEMAKEMWKQNTEYTIILCNDIMSPDFLKYIDEKGSIILAKESDFKNITSLDLLNNFIKKFNKYVKKHNIRLVIIASEKGDAIRDKIGRRMGVLYNDVQIITENIMGREDTPLCIKQIMNND